MALPAGYHRREHPFFTRGHIHRRRVEFYPGGRTCGIDLLQHLAADANCRPERSATADLDSQQPFLLSGQGVELEVKRSELQDLQAFNQDIIHSMRGGLLTTDLEGRILLLNRTGEEITGYRFVAVRGKSLADIWPVFWLPGEMTQDGKLPQRREVDFLTPDGQKRFIGLSASMLSTGERRTTGYVFNFQDLTELKHLEQEVATKDRMAALGRLSA